MNGNPQISSSNVSKVSKFFHEFAYNFDSLYDQQRNWLMQWLDRHFRSDIFLRFALTFEALSPMEGMTVLDIGCGSGPYVLEACRLGAARVTAVDPASNMLKLVQQRLSGTPYLERCTLVESAVPKVVLPPHDYVIVMGVMDYVEEALPFLQAVRAMTLKRAAVSFTSKHWFRTPFRRFRYYFRNCPLYFYDDAMIRKLGIAAGFRDIRIHKIPGAGMDYHVLFE